MQTRVRLRLGQFQDARGVSAIATAVPPGLQEGQIVDTVLLVVTDDEFTYLRQARRQGLYLKAVIEPRMPANEQRADYSRERGARHTRELFDIFVRLKTENGGDSPTIREFTAAAKLGSTSTANYHLHKMHQQGLIILHERGRVEIPGYAFGPIVKATQAL